jgi:hypothetical protein
MNIRTLRFPFIAGLALLLAACSGAPGPAAKKEEKPPEPITGQSALFRMYQSARTWAPDVQILKMSSVLLSEVPDAPRGTAAAWQATFVSPSRSRARSYTYCVIELLPMWHKGSFAGPEEAAPSGGANATYPMAAVSKDTDLAYKVALEHGEDYDKKNPGKPITFLLEKIAKFPDPVWRVVWGESVGTSSFSIYVDASTGDYKEKLH